MGAFLAQHRLRRGEQRALARLLEKSVRTMRTWQRQAGKTGLPGRPRHSAEAREKARAQTERVRRTLVCGQDGWRSVSSELEREGVVVPVRLIQESLRALKAEQRQRVRARIEEQRVHVEVLARDALWALDQTQVLRDEHGLLESLVVRECLVPHTLGLSIGPPACGADVVGLLERAAEERGSWPFVVQMDNGPENKNAEVQACLREARVIALWNEPRTLEHNARAERTIGSLKRASGLGTQRSGGADATQGPVCTRQPGVSSTRTSLCARLLAAWERLEHAPRAQLDGLSPAELDRIAPGAEDHASRARFYTEVCEELRKIALAPNKPRARRKEEREAIWCALERHGLVTRTRGGRPIPTLKAEAVS